MPIGPLNRTVEGASWGPDAPRPRYKHDSHFAAWVPPVLATRSKEYPLSGPGIAGDCVPPCMLLAFLLLYGRI